MKMRFAFVLLFALGSILFVAGMQPVQAEMAAPTHAVYLPLVIGDSSGNNPTPTPIVSPTPTPTPLPQRPDTRYGMVADFDTAFLDALASSGASWTMPTLHLHWSDIEPSEGARDWAMASALESQLAAAVQKGLNVILVIDSTPEWARLVPGMGAHCGPVSPDKLSAMAAFVQDAALRYSAPPYQVNAWQLYDGADRNRHDFADNTVPGCWGDDTDDVSFGGDDYGAMLNAVAPAIWAVTPDADILVGGLLLPSPFGEQARFFQGVIHDGGDDHFTGVSFYAHDTLTAFDLPWGTAHQYTNFEWGVSWQNGTISFVEKAAFLNEQVAAIPGAHEVALWPRVGLDCATCVQSSPPSDSEPIEYKAAKADYLARSYAMSGDVEHVRVLLWDDLETLVGGDGTPSFADDPAFYAYQVSRTEGPDALAFAGYVSSAEAGNAPGVFGRKYSGTTRDVWVVWLVSTQANTVDVTFSPTPAMVFDTLGDPIFPMPGVPVGIAPLYLVFEK